ncbi:MAG: hypothetical protein R2830_12895 [Saprospiraceae bacterium]
MVFIGNIVLAIASLVFYLLAKEVLFTKMPGGDAGVGYAWALIIGVLVFSICMAVVTAIVGSQGGFSWVGSPGGNRFLLVLGGFVLIMVGNGFFMAGEGFGGLPNFIRKIFTAIPAILPPLLIICAAVLLNADRSAVPAFTYKLPIYLGFVSGLLAVGFILSQNARNAAAVRQSNIDFEDRNHQNHLNNIDSTDVMKNGVFLYVYTDANHDKDVRERALAKLKTRPDWQEELVRRLQNDWAPEAFTFLASNEVDDKTLFPEAVRQGVLIQARLIRENIRKCRDTYDLYAGRFTWEVERVLRTVDKFQGMGVDYRPAVQEMRNSLDEPTSFEKPKLSAKGILDKWLKKH